MTIIEDYCPECEESCFDHATVCTMCGTTLQARPSSAANNNNNSVSFSLGGLSAAGLTTSVSAGSEELNAISDLVQSNQELATVLQRLRQRVVDIRQQVSDIRENNFLQEAMDPQAAGGRKKTSSAQTLESLTRISVTPNCSLLHQATLRVTAASGEGGGANDATADTTTNTTLEAVVAEFGPYHNLTDAALVLAQPLTGGTNSTKTLENQNIPITLSSPFIMYMERGNGVTFCQKGVTSTSLGCMWSGDWESCFKHDRCLEEADLSISAAIYIIFCDSRNDLDGQYAIRSTRERLPPNWIKSRRVDQEYLSSSLGNAQVA